MPRANQSFFVECRYARATRHQSTRHCAAPFSVSCAPRFSLFEPAFRFYRIAATRTCHAPFTPRGALHSASVTRCLRVPQRCSTRISLRRCERRFSIIDLFCSFTTFDTYCSRHLLPLHCRHFAHFIDRQRLCFIAIILFPPLKLSSFRHIFDSDFERRHDATFSAFAFFITLAFAVSPLSPARHCSAAGALALPPLRLRCRFFARYFRFSAFFQLSPLRCLYFASRDARDFFRHFH